MIYISKTASCSEWDIFTRDYQHALKNKTWGKLTNITKKDKKTGERIKVGSIIKVKLHEYLWKDQKSLCIYCLQEIKAHNKREKSHIEHIFPKSIRKDLRFEFTNLAVSCNGIDCSSESDKFQKEFCGHFKDDESNAKKEFNEDLFLHPHEVHDIHDYFEYDITGKIKPNKTRSPTEQKKANYMIELVGLNDPILVSFREEAYLSLISIEANQGEADVLILLDNKSKIYTSFQPMLRALYGL